MLPRFIRITDANEVETIVNIFHIVSYVEGPDEKTYIFTSDGKTIHAKINFYKFNALVEAELKD